MDWPTTKYRLNAKAFAPRFPGTDHELLEAGTEIVSNLKPGPHMDALTPEGEEAKRRAGHQELDFTRHQPLAVGDEDDQLAARVAKATAVALAQMGVVPGGAATQPETVALAEENAALKARLEAIEATLMNLSMAQASQANAAPVPAAPSPPVVAASPPPPPPPVTPPPPPPPPPPAKRK